MDDVAEREMAASSRDRRGWVGCGRINSRFAYVKLMLVIGLVWPLPWIAVGMPAVFAVMQSPFAAFLVGIPACVPFLIVSAWFLSPDCSRGRLSKGERATVVALSLGAMLLSAAMAMNWRFAPMGRTSGGREAFEMRFHCPKPESVANVRYSGDRLDRNYKVWMMFDIAETDLRKVLEDGGFVPVESLAGTYLDWNNRDGPPSWWQLDPQCDEYWMSPGRPGFPGGYDKLLIWKQGSETVWAVCLTW